jgi:hypothetical protein
MRQVTSASCYPCILHAARSSGGAFYLSSCTGVSLDLATSAPVSNNTAVSAGGVAAMEGCQVRHHCSTNWVDIPQNAIHDWCVSRGSGDRLQL